jgi:hypothetical protein
LDQHAKESEEFDKHDNPLLALFYIDIQTLPIIEHPWYKNLVYAVSEMSK